MTKFRDLRGRLRARSTLLTAPLLTRVESRVRSRNCLTNGNFLSSGMRRSRTAAIGITHAITLCGRTLGTSHYSSPAFTISTNAAKAANRGILRRETLLVSEIVAPPHPRLRRSFSLGRSLERLASFVIICCASRGLGDARKASPRKSECAGG